MLCVRICADGWRAPLHRYDESDGENSDAEHDYFRDGHGGGRRAGHHGQDGGRVNGRGRGHCVHFDDEEFDNFDQEEGSNENPFANDRQHRRCHDHRRCADHGDREHHRGHHNKEDPNNIAFVKLRIPKFTGREDADAYLEWAE